MVRKSLNRIDAKVNRILIDVVCVRAYKRGPLEAGMSWGLLVEKVEKVGRDARAAALGRHPAH